MKRVYNGERKGRRKKKKRVEREKKKNIDRKHAVSARCCNRCNAIAISASETAIRSRPIKGATEGREDGRGGREHFGIFSRFDLSSRVDKRERWWRRRRGESKVGASGPRLFCLKPRGPDN